MMRKYLVRIVDSPFVLVLLMIATLVCGIAWRRVYAAATPPAIVGYDWGKHPNALMVVVPPDECGCGMKPSKVAQQAVAQNVDVVVLASRSSDSTKEVEDLGLPHQKLALFLDAPENTVRRFSHKQGFSVVRVIDGRITQEFEGNLPEDFFETMLHNPHKPEVKS